MPASQPNILFIVVDDCGYADLGCTGQTDYQTPALDRLAAEGIRFTQAYANSALCTNTRGCQSAIGRCKSRNLLERDMQRRQCLIEPLHDGVSRTDSGQMKSSLTAGVETYRGLEMLDRQLRLTGEEAQPAAPIPPIGEARIEHERAIDQGESGINVL